MFCNITVAQHTVRQFDTTQLNDWKQQQSFQYKRGIEPSLNLWDRIKLWILRQWYDMMSTAAGENTFWIIVAALSIAIIVFFVWKYGSKGNRMWSKSDKGSIDLEQIEEENIHEINFEDKIQEAESSGNYRLAIRLQYLYILKKLDEKENIIWKSGKTNYDYILELKKNISEDGFSLFKQISIAFDFAWYGEHTATMEDYNQVKSLVEQLEKNSFKPQNIVLDERI